MKNVTISIVILIMLLSIQKPTPAQTSLPNFSTNSQDDVEPVNWNSKGIIMNDESNRLQAKRINNNWCIQSDSEHPKLIIKSIENKKEEPRPLIAGYTNENEPTNDFHHFFNICLPPLSNLSYSCLLLKHDYSYYWAYNFRWKAFSNLLDSLKNNSNLRIQDLDTYGWDYYYYSGTWIGDNKGWAYALNYTISDDFASIIKGWGDQGYRVSDLEINLYGDDLNYGAVAIQDNSGYSWIYNTTISGLQTWFTEQENENRRIIDVEGYRSPVSNELLFAGVAETNSPSYSWKAVANYIWNDFESLQNTMNTEGYHISDYEVYCYHGQTYYAGTWIKDSKGSGWLLNFADLDNFKQELNNYINTKQLRPVKFNIWDRLEDTAIQPVDEILLTDFKLVHNFPNPFNPITTFTYQIPQRAKIALSIYNLNGQLVETLINEEIEPGIYNRQWNASHLSSGIYYYRFEAGDHIEKGRCVLLK